MTELPWDYGTDPDKWRLPNGQWVSQDEYEKYRTGDRKMTGITIHNYDSGNKPEDQTWDTKQLTEEFEVLGFSAPFVVVIRRSDGVKGVLEFSHAPRLYFDFQPSV
jgi:hypothetical protein